MSTLVFPNRIGQSGVLVPREYYEKGDDISVRIDRVFVDPVKGLRINSSIADSRIPTIRDQLRTAQDKRIVLTGKINNITTDGCFVTLGGESGLIARGNAPAGLVKGQSVEVTVVGVRQGAKRLLIDLMPAR